MLSKSSL